MLQNYHLFTNWIEHLFILSENFKSIVKKKSLWSCHLCWDIYLYQYIYIYIYTYTHKHNDNFSNIQMLQLSRINRDIVKT